VAYPFSLILASGSPRRIALLKAMGLDVMAQPADIDESPRYGEGPQALVRRLAATKALTVAQGFPETLVLGADTVVAVGRTIVGKPHDSDDAMKILAELSGRSHQVYTGTAVYRERSEMGWVHVDVAKVTFRPLTKAEIVRYVETQEPMDKAGAYAIQGEAGNWVESFEGNLETVIGLARDRVEALLTRASHWMAGVGGHA